MAMAKDISVHANFSFSGLIIISALEKDKKTTFEVALEAFHRRQQAFCDGVPCAANHRD